MPQGTAGKRKEETRARETGNRRVHSNEGGEGGIYRGGEAQTGPGTGDSPISRILRTDIVYVYARGCAWMSCVKSCVHVYMYIYK